MALQINNPEELLRLRGKKTGFNNKIALIVLKI
jgi:hypothetical protein